MRYTINSDLTAVPEYVDKIKILKWLGTKEAGTLQVLVHPIIQIGKLLSINPIYILAHAILESGWGQSRIAKEKNNLFGYGAYDADPYDSAFTFPNRECCILFVIWKISRHYLDKDGKYYGGEPSLWGMNKKYASDSGWADKIVGIMNQIEEFNG